MVARRGLAHDKTFCLVGNTNPQTAIGGAANNVPRGFHPYRGTMFPVPTGVQVWLASRHTDMRKRFDGLVVLV